MNAFVASDEFMALLAPLSENNGAGVDLRLNTSPTSGYQVLRNARSAARNNERSALSAGEVMYFSFGDWAEIISAAPQVLAEESKDLEIVAWYIEALARCEGFGGIAKGFSLAARLIEQFGGSLYPLPDEDGLATQLAPLIGLNGFGSEGALIAPIKSIPLTEGSPPGPLATWQCEQSFELDRISDPEKREARLKQGGIAKDTLMQIVAETSTDFIHTLQRDIQNAIAAYEDFQGVIDQYASEDPQPTGKLKETLDSCYQVLTYIAGDRLKKEQVEEPVEDPDSDDDQSSASNEKTARRMSVEDVVINDRQDALLLLREISSFFRRTEPHSPISYSCDQIIRWSSMPLTELINELIPDDGARKKFKHLSGIGAVEAND
ncbi:type VI secretion system protein TssA [Aurantivibrio plasticivorans]